VESGAHFKFPCSTCCRNSNALDPARHTTAPLSENLYRRLAQKRERKVALAASRGSRPTSSLLLRWGSILLVVLVSYGAFRALELLRQVRLVAIEGNFEGRARYLPFASRVVGTAAAWTIPAGVLSFHPKLARIAQPLAQIRRLRAGYSLFPVILLH